MFPPLFPPRWPPLLRCARVRRIGLPAGAGLRLNRDSSMRPARPESAPGEAVAPVELRPWKLLRPGLTDLVAAGGCAAKYSAARLEELLRGFVPAEDAEPARRPRAGRRCGGVPARRRARDRLHARLLPARRRRPGGLRRDRGDERPQRRLRDGRPPLLALSVAAFPEELPIELLGRSPRRRARAGARRRRHPRRRPPLRDAEPKYGLAVVGTVASRTALWTKAARPGDALFLTKPLGTGLVLHGARARPRRRGRAREAVDWMRTLNRDAADALRPFEPSAVTDVTGFGLLGHAHEIAERSGVRLVLDAAAAGPRRRARPSQSRGERPAATGATASSPRRTSTSTACPSRASRSPTTRRPPAACSSRSRPSVPRRSRPSSPPATSSSRRIGSVEAGSGISLA